MASATYRDYPGAMITAAYAAPNSIDRAVARPEPGGGRQRHRHRATGRAGHDVRAPAAGARSAVLEAACASGKAASSGNLDVFNIFNSTSIVTLNTTYGPNWQRPTLLQGARFMKISAQIDF